MQKLALAIVAVMFTQAVSAAQKPAALPDPVISKLSAFTPQVVLDLTKPPQKVRIQYRRADLEGTGKFDLIVAVYLAPLGGKIRVLRDVNGSLELAADLDPSKELDTNGTVGLEVADIAQTGKPQIVVKSFGSHTQYDLDLLAWTGTSLKSLLPAGGSFENAQFMDIDGNGVLEIVTPPSCQDNSDPNEVCTHTFRVYKFSGAQYVLAFTSQADPTGQISQAGNAQNVFGDAQIRPDDFNIEQIRAAREKHESSEGEVTLRLGNLTAPVDDNPGPRSVDDLDLKSLILGRNIRPLRARIVPAEDDSEDAGKPASADDDSKDKKPVELQGPFVEAKFNQQAVLEFLPRTQLTKQIEPGDKLTLEIRGKMKNGAPVFSSVQVTIVGEHEADQPEKPKG